MNTQNLSDLRKSFVYRKLAATELRRYQEEGYLLVGKTLTDAGLEQIRAECMQAWNAEKGPYDPNATWLLNALLPNIHHRSALVRDFYFHGPLVDVAERLIGPNVKAATSQLTFKLRGNTKAFGWHQDNGYGELEPYTAVSTLTALDDADQSNGCLWLIPGSHRRGQIPVAQTVEQKQRQTEVTVAIDERGAIPLPMKAGETLLFHCWTLHKSEGNRSDLDRRILFMRYADADAVEVYNDRKPRLGRLLRGKTRFPQVEQFEADIA
jgi:hypothetical protein